MDRSLFLVLLLVCLATADDEYHRSAVRSRNRRSAAATTGAPENDVGSSTHQGNDMMEDIASVDLGQINQGPLYVDDDEPCEEDDLRGILEHNRTRRKTCSLAGIWYNGVGSEMILNVSSQGLIGGEYRTAVEKGWGSAGEGSSKVTGYCNVGDSHPVFGLTVVWNEGESVTTWTGQCLVCNGIETLETTWVLNSRVDSCHHKWMANRMGQNSFTRREQKLGPRKALNTHTPRDFWNVPKRTGFL